MHKRLDYPQTDIEQRHYLAVGGLDKLWVRPEAVEEEILQPSCDKVKVLV